MSRKSRERMMTGRARSAPGEDSHRRYRQPWNTGEPRITEAEYTAALPGRAQKIADDLTATLPEWARDAGLRFEWH